MYTQNKTLEINSTPIQNNNKLQMNLHEPGLEETREWRTYESVLRSARIVI